MGSRRLTCDVVAPVPRSLQLPGQSLDKTTNSFFDFQSFNVPASRFNSQQLQQELKTFSPLISQQNNQQFVTFEPVRPTPERPENNQEFVSFTPERPENNQGFVSFTPEIPEDNQEFVSFTPEIPEDNQEFVSFTPLTVEDSK